MTRVIAALVVMAGVSTPVALVQAEVQAIVAAHFLGPPKIALEVGGLIKPNDGNAAWWPTATVAAGVSGGQLSLGIAHPLRRTDVGGPGAEFSLRLQGTVLRTWRAPRYADPDRTYVGLELTLSVHVLMGIRVGLLQPVSAAGSRNPVASAGFLVGWL